MIKISNPGGDERFLLQNVNTVSGAHVAPCFPSRGYGARGMKMNTRLHVEPRLRISGAVIQLPSCIRDLGQGNFFFCGKKHRV